MSSGLSRGQSVIDGLLYGSLSGEVYDNLDEGCDTSELLEELLARDLVNPSAPRKQQMFTVVRACRSLERRGLIRGERVKDVDHPHCWTIHWTAIR
jgi:hypothetical protein